MCMSVYLHHMCAWCLSKPEEGVRSSELELQIVTVMWVLETKPRSLARKQVLFTSEPFL